MKVLFSSWAIVLGYMALVAAVDDPIFHAVAESVAVGIAAYVVAFLVWDVVDNGY